jgi:hypothetical protein
LLLNRNFSRSARFSSSSSDADCFKIPHLIEYFVNPLLQFTIFQLLPNSYRLFEISPAVLAMLQADAALLNGSMR